MASPDILAGRLRHVANAAVKSAWFGVHYLAARRSAGRLVPKGERFTVSRPLPTLAQTMRSLRSVIDRDRRNVEQGVYPAPEGPPVDLQAALKTSRAFLADAAKVAARRREGASQEAATIRPDLPRYYRQNFHYQTDGYLSAESASLYDFQVETLFAGTAQAMRRQALPFLADAFRGRDQRALRLLEIACGTGALTEEITRAFPRLGIVATDPSADYLERARKRLKGRPSVALQESFVEALPFEQDAFDAAASCYLFHELPPKIRTAAVKELARVVKPGGLYVHLDSLQYGHTPGFDGLLEAFPRLFHEPYYASYAELDLERLFNSGGFEKVGETTAFLTKVTAFRLT